MGLDATQYFSFFSFPFITIGLAPAFLQSTISKMAKMRGFCAFGGCAGTARPENRNVNAARQTIWILFCMVIEFSQKQEANSNWQSAKIKTKSKSFGPQRTQRAQRKTRQQMVGLGSLRSGNLYPGAMGMIRPRGKSPVPPRWGFNSY